VGSTPTGSRTASATAQGTATTTRGVAAELARTTDTRPDLAPVSTTSAARPAQPQAAVVKPPAASRPATVPSSARPQDAPVAPVAPAPKPKRPANDTAKKAVAVGPLPWSTQLDVAGATLDTLEAGLATDCGLATADRAVWYRVDDPNGVGFVADAS